MGHLCQCIDEYGHGNAIHLHDQSSEVMNVLIDIYILLPPARIESFADNDTPSTSSFNIDSGGK